MRSILDTFCAMSLQTNLSDASLNVLAIELIQAYESEKISLVVGLTPAALVAGYDSLSPRQLAQAIKRSANGNATSTTDHTPRGRYSI
jgi:hypothetical protein